MQLSFMERWTLSNQYRILEKLALADGDEHGAIQHAQTADALERGFELVYSWQIPHLEREPLAEDECKEVLDILEMFTQLRWAYDGLHDKAGIEEHFVTFTGWDGNDSYESQLCLFAEWICRGGSKFTDLGERAYGNSHAPLLPMYRAMLKVWKELDRYQPLSKADILAIIQGWVDEREKLDADYAARQAKRH